MKNGKLIPRLRFPDFTGEWEEKPLSNFLFEHKTKSDGKCEVHSVSVSKGVINQVEYLGRSFAAADTSKYNLAKPNDIIYTKSPTGDFPYGIVKQNKNPYNVIVSPLYAVYTPINKHVGYILDSYFESPANTNNYLSSLVQKGAKNTIQISNDTFISKTMCLPTNPAEQEKIASCLSELDNLIVAQGQKVDALKEKKKGLMQQLFPQPGETTPRLRFPGFEGEWVEKKLGEVATSFSGGTPKSGNPLYYGGTIPFIRSGEIHGEETALFITEEGLNNSSAKLVNKGDLLFALYGATSGEVDLSKIDGAINQAILCIRSKTLNACFLCNYLESKKEFVVSHFLQGGQGNLSGDIIMSLNTIYPSSAEQQKIASCLSSLDDLIAAESAKVEALKDHKKGLMQQLFPQPAK